MLESKFKGRILIVDDEKTIADTLALILNATGWETEVAYSGESALEAAERFKPDVLISDVFMGGISGIEVAILLAKKQPNCKVILFSGQAATADLLSAADSQGRGFEVLTKPVQPEVLIERVRHLALPVERKS